MDEPIGREIRVRTVAPGVCHIDLHVVDGAIQRPNDDPVVLGHEGRLSSRRSEMTSPLSGLVTTWSGAAGTQFLADPKEGLLLLCFTQVLNHRAIPGNTFWEDFDRPVYQSLS